MEDILRSISAPYPQSSSPHPPNTLLPNRHPLPHTNGLDRSVYRAKPEKEAAIITDRRCLKTTRKHSIIEVWPKFSETNHFRTNRKYVVGIEGNKKRKDKTYRLEMTY